MREILFRGRRSWGNKKWVEGDLLHGYCDHVSITKRLMGIETWQVEPETVGQYTGLCDKNGKKIFEGDICKAYICIADTVEKEVIGTICFEDGTFEFKCEHDNVYIYPLLEVLEVIGNIYDNPELLKGE